MVNNFFNKNSDYFYFVFRVLVGLVFLLHGVMKVQMMMGGSLTVMSLIGLAMVIEIVGGAFIILGLFTRYTAIISAIEMIFAYFMVHASGGLSPITNNGEPAVLFFASFLVLMAFGARKWGIDKK